jgi:hypothetical protein
LSLQIAVYLVAKVKLTQMKNRLKEVKALWPERGLNPIKTFSLENTILMNNSRFNKTRTWRTGKVSREYKFFWKNLEFYKTNSSLHCHKWWKNPLHIAPCNYKTLKAP